jgi:glycosyltransferase involved in cell wall biosynthesis
MLPERESRVRFTVFTPTYNRRHLLSRVMDSLQQQTLRDFEWIVVDDGSTDGTAAFLEEFALVAPFRTRVLRSVKNCGKHVAWNRAVREAKGELFVIADSDDSFAPESLEIFWNTWTSIPEEQRTGYSGVTVLCRNAESGAVVGESFPESPFDSDQLTLHFEQRIRGEKWGCVRTDLLRQVPFPELPASHFAENYVWFRLARRYRVRCVNEALRIFFDDQRSDRLTKERRASVPASRFEAGYTWNTIHLNENFDYLRSATRELIVTLTHLARSGRILRKPAVQTCTSLNRLSLRILFWVLYPVSLYLYQRDRMQERFRFES